MATKYNNIATNIYIFSIFAFAFFIILEDDYISDFVNAQIIKLQHLQSCIFPERWFTKLPESFANEADLIPPEYTALL